MNSTITILTTKEKRQKSTSVNKVRLTKIIYIKVCHILNIKKKIKKTCTLNKNLLNWIKFLLFVFLSPKSS